VKLEMKFVNLNSTFKLDTTENMIGWPLFLDCPKYFLLVGQDGHCIYIGVNSTDGGGIS